MQTGGGHSFQTGQKRREILVTKLQATTILTLKGSCSCSFPNIFISLSFFSRQFLQLLLFLPPMVSAAEQRPASYLPLPSQWFQAREILRAVTAFLQASPT